MCSRGRGCVALITALGEKGDLPHPIALDYAAARSPNQTNQSDPEQKRHHCESEQEASPVFFVHVYICEKWPKRGSKRGSPLSFAFTSGLTQRLACESPVVRIALLGHWAA